MTSVRLLNSSMKTLGSSLFWRGFNLIKTEEESSCALLRHGNGCLCLGYPTPAQMRPNHLFLAKAGACVRFHLDLFKDYDFKEKKKTGIRRVRYLYLVSKSCHNP